MKCIIYSIIALIAVTGQINIFSALAAGSPLHHPDRIILKFEDTSSLYKDVRNVLQAVDIKSIQVDNQSVSGKIENFMREISLIELWPIHQEQKLKATPQGLERIFLAKYQDNLSIDDVLAVLNNHSDIEYAEPDYVGFGSGKVCEKESPSYLRKTQNTFPNDSYFSDQWGLKNDGQEIGGYTGYPGADINILDGWEITTGSSDIVMAVLDSGIPKEHPEFSGRLVDGYDYANDNNDPEDDHGHGTSVASIAAATGNNGGLMAGVDWSVKIMPVKILNNENWGWYSWWISGIKYAVDNGARVINMSVGGTDISESLKDAVNYALDNEVIVVASVMNTDNDDIFYPAGYEGVISVGAINNRDMRASPFCWGGGSNYGDHIDFAAPGERIVSLNYQNFESTSFWCGTSQAAPMVAGTITLMLSVNNTLTRAEIYDILKETTREQVQVTAKANADWDHYYGWGRIDMYAALDEVRNITSISDLIDEEEITGDYRLAQNYPNPFNPSTTIEYEIADAGRVKIIIYSIVGSEITTIVDKHQQPGWYSVTFDAGDLPSGVYVYTIRVNDFVQSKMMMLLQ